MTDQSLFPARRVCVACEESARVGKRVAGEPNIVAICLGVYRKGSGKSKIQAAGSVHICEACLVRAIAPSIFGVSGEAKKLLASLRDRISARYSAMLDEESPR